MSTATLAQPTVLSPEIFTFFRKLVLDRAAIVLEDSKTYLVESRLHPVALKNGMSSLADLVDALRKRPGGPLQDEVVEALTTNETSFFRDQAPFDALRKTVLPQLVTARGSRRELSIWSAACSCGQELYSVAMTIREHFPDLKSWNLRLLGTDLNTQVLARAKAGSYNQTEVNRGLPALFLAKYFRKQGLQWVVQDELRNLTSWQPLNLIEPWQTIPPMDIIFLRNVLIYFSPETKRKILAQVKKVLRPDGFLFLGGAETTMNLDDSFVRFPCDGAVCYRLPSAKAAT